MRPSYAGVLSIIVFIQGSLHTILLSACHCSVLQAEVLCDHAGYSNRMIGWQRCCQGGMEHVLLCPRQAGKKISVLHERREQFSTPPSNGTCEHRLYKVVRRDDAAHSQLLIHPHTTLASYALTAYIRDHLRLQVVMLTVNNVTQPTCTADRFTGWDGIPMQ